MYETTVYLDTMITLSPKDCKTDLTFVFEMEDANDTVYIDTEYTPKFFYDLAASKTMLENGVRRFGLDPETDLYDCTTDAAFPLANMVILSLDINGDYRGAAHRHANAQHILLSEAQTTNGFSPGVLPTGTWRITLHVFSMLTEQCKYHISVTGVRRATESE